MQAARYIVGIDLGTTNTVVAYSERGEAPRIFSLPQATAASETSALPRLPSCLYAPTPEEASAPAAAQGWLVGEFARQRAGEAPQRSITSAKSWLCHAHVNRTEPILPWGDTVAGGHKLSPVAASTLILQHVRAAWNASFPEAPLEAQSVILTVPASFDPVARKLTLEAAANAGISARLLEEPQAAFYALLGKAGEERIRALFANSQKSVLVLVCDVGGGTTDLCLIRAHLDEQGALELERTAVGRHLLLGGDNMDLALAHFMESRFCPSGERLPAAEFVALTQACRHAKERLLASDTPVHERITLLGTGSNLFQGARTSELSREDTLQVVLEGFFPAASGSIAPLRTQAGLLGFGLPYERDARVSVHMTHFLETQTQGDSGLDAVLFNGGVFHSQAIAERVHAVLRSWGTTPTLLPSASLDDAVAHGAVCYGLALRGQGLRISSGTAHSYYLGIAPSQSERSALCIVPRGSKEGEVHVARPAGLFLQTGREVRFDLFASDALQIHAAGQVAAVSAKHFELLPPIAVHFESESSAQIPVHLEGCLTPLGTLELACVNAETQQRFELLFELRGHEMSKVRPASAPISQREAAVSVPPISAKNTQQTQLSEAYEAIQRVFGKGRVDVKEREVRDLFRVLEKLLGERRSWDLKLCRALFDVVGPKFAARRRSVEHERVFWMLAGLCLRPGFGHALDAGRVALLQPLFEEGTAFGQEPRNWQAFFIAWRRIAGGLPEATQLNLRRLLDPFVATSEAGLKKPKGFKAEVSSELIALAAWLERVPVDARALLGGWLLERTWTDRNPELWAAIGRIGARVPAYASAHHVLSGKTVERWLDHLLREKWDQVRTAPRAALQLCRITDDRTRDVSASMRQRVLEKLSGLALPPNQLEPLLHFVPVEANDRLEFFDHDLPSGLSIAPPSLETP